ncbi:MAG: hypothetical protein U0U66_09735 [Cytophagaceae bacterium]
MKINNSVVWIAFSSGFICASILLLLWNYLSGGHLFTIEKDSTGSLAEWLFGVINVLVLGFTLYSLVRQVEIQNNDSRYKRVSDDAVIYSKRLDEIKKRIDGQFAILNRSPHVTYSWIDQKDFDLFCSILNKYYRAADLGNELYVCNHVCRVMNDLINMVRYFEKIDNALLVKDDLFVEYYSYFNIVRILEGENYSQLTNSFNPHKQFLISNGLLNYKMKLSEEFNKSSIHRRLEEI